MSFNDLAKKEAAEKGASKANDPKSKAGSEESRKSDTTSTDPSPN